MMCCIYWRTLLCIDTYVLADTAILTCCPVSAFVSPQRQSMCNYICSYIAPTLFSNR